MQDLLEVCCGLDVHKVIIYNLLKNGVDYDETTFEKVKQKQAKFKISRIITEAKRIGLEIKQSPTTA